MTKPRRKGACEPAQERTLERRVLLRAPRASSRVERLARSRSDASEERRRMGRPSRRLFVQPAGARRRQRWRKEHPNRRTRRPDFETEGGDPTERPITSPGHVPVGSGASRTPLDGESRNSRASRPRVARVPSLFTDTGGEPIAGSPVHLRLGLRRRFPPSAVSRRADARTAGRMRLARFEPNIQPRLLARAEVEGGRCPRQRSLMMALDPRTPRAQSQTRKTSHCSRIATMGVIT